MPEGKYVSYLRVSTKRQGESGLGLEAQRSAVEDFLDGGSWSLLGEYVEVESGKKDDRPKLADALHHCELTGATLVVAKMDRLSRDAVFLLTLQKSGVNFLAVDNPHANGLTVGILAVVAQDERKRISERTKAALAAAKARGVKLGCPNGAAHLRKYGNALGVEAVKRNADERAQVLAKVIAEVDDGEMPLRKIAEELNRREIKTARGGSWHPQSVKRLKERLAG